MDNEIKVYKTIVYICILAIFILTVLNYDLVGHWGVFIGYLLGMLMMLIIIPFSYLNDKKKEED